MTRAGHRGALGVMAVTTVVSAALRTLLPINTIGLFRASFDGGLYEKLTVSLVHHQWLGTFDTTTLAKGPGYSLFMAAAYRLHLPVQVAEQIAYLAGALAIAAAVWVVTQRAGWAAAVYVVLAFDPVNYSSISTNITRENFYTGPALLFVGAAFLALYCALAGRPWWMSTTAAVVAGLSGALFWITREEGVWVLGGLALMGAALGAGVLVGRDGIGRKLVHGSVTVAVLAIAFAAPIKWLERANQRNYGAPLVTDFAGGSFPQAFDAWTRVRGVPLRAFVPIDAAQRAVVYPVSPAARQLEPYLEDPTNGWRMVGCQGNNVCDDYAGSGEPWAIRDAAKSAGVFENEASFQAYFARVANEINRACDRGALRCSRALPGSLQLTQRATIGGVTRSAWKWFKLLPAHFTVFESYNAQGANKVPAAERRTIATGVRYAPQTQRAAVAQGKSYESRDWIFGIIRELYRLLWKLLIPAAVVVALACLWPGNRPRSWACVVLAAGLFLAVVTRLVIFGVIETTQYFGDMRYQLVAHSFLLAALVVLVSVAPEQASFSRLWEWAQAFPRRRFARG